MWVGEITDMADNTYTNLGALPTNAPSSKKDWDSLLSSLSKWDREVKASVRNKFFDTLQKYNNILQIDRKDDTAFAKANISGETADTLYALCKEYVKSIVTSKRSLTEDMSARNPKYNWIYPKATLQVSGWIPLPKFGSLHAEARSCYENVLKFLSEITAGKQILNAIKYYQDACVYWWIVENSDAEKRAHAIECRGEREHSIACLLYAYTRIDQIAANLYTGADDTRFCCVLSLPQYGASKANESVNKYNQDEYLAGDGTYQGHALF